MKVSRRNFVKTSAIVSAGLIAGPTVLDTSISGTTGYPVRLGGPVPGNFTDPVEWIKALKSLGYSAAYCPVQPGASSELIKAFSTEAKKNNILIAEAGVWNSPLDPDDTVRQESIRKNIDMLALADEIGALCCVNVSGARGKTWNAPYAENYADDTFALIVDTVRSIIDQVKPGNAYYTLEPMPYMLPDSPDSYLDLIKAIDRKQFAAHLDPVNMISSPQRYFKNAEFIKECFAKLGPYIKSVHAKDINILHKLTVHLEEIRPGLGALDYTVLLQEASKIKDIPVMLEHLDTQEDYKLAAEYVRETGKKAGITFV